MTLLATVIILASRVNVLLHEQLSHIVAYCVNKYLSALTTVKYNWLAILVSIMSC